MMPTKKTFREQVSDPTVVKDLEFAEGVLNEVIRSREIRPTAFWEWVDRIESVANRHEQSAESEKPVGPLEGRIDLATWGELREKYRTWAGAYRELLKTPDVVKAIEGPWRLIT